MKIFQKSFWAFFTLLFFPGGAIAQNYAIDDTTKVYTCSGTFTDGGGPSSDYGSSVNDTITFCPDSTNFNGNGVSIFFPLSDFDVDASDTLFLYDGPDASSPLLNKYYNGSPQVVSDFTMTPSNPSGCLTLVFISDGSTQGTGWEADLNCDTACQFINPEITAIPAAEPQNDSGYIDICQDDTVIFNAYGEYPQSDSASLGYPYYQQSDSTSDFMWVIDGDTSYQQTEEVVFNQAAGYFAEVVITDTLGCASTISAKRRVRVSTTPSFEGTPGLANDTVCNGDTVDLTGYAQPDTGFFSTPGGISGDSIFLPDGSGVSYQTDIDVSGFSPGQTLSNINDLQNICMVMEHSYIGDLQIELSCPSGQTIVLADTYNGNGGNDFLGEPVDNNTGTPGVGYQYCFNSSPTYGTWVSEVGGYNYSYTDVMGNNYSNQSYLPSGSYASEQPLSNLVGCTMNGTWTLTITDNLSIDDGYLFSWDLFFATSTLPGSQTYVPSVDSTYWDVTAPTAVQAPTDTTMLVAPDSVGPFEYSFYMTDSMGCTYDTSISIVMASPLVVSPDTAVCDSSISLEAENVMNGGYWTYEGPSPGDTAIFAPDSNSEDPTVTVRDSGRYQFVFHDTTCSSTDTAEVNFHFPPILSPDTVVCDTFVQLEADGAPFGGVWSSSGPDTVIFTPNDSSLNPIAHVDTLGSYDLIFTSGKCNYQDTTTVGFNPQPVIVPQDTFICGDSVSLQVNNTPGAGYWTIHSRPAGSDSVTFSPDTTSNNPIVTVVDSGTYELVFHDVNCGKTDTAKVAFHLPPSLSEDTIVCDSMVQLHAEGAPFGGTWTFDGPSGSNVMFDPNNTALDPIGHLSTPGIYDMIFTTALCSYEDTVNVQYNPDPVIVPSDTSLCTDSVSLQVNNVSAGYWTVLLTPGTVNPDSVKFGPDTTSLNPTVSVPDSGFYRLVFHDSVCNKTDTADLSFHLPPVVSNDTTVCGLTHRLWVSGAPEGGMWDHYTTQPNAEVTYDPDSLDDYPLVHVDRPGIYHFVYTEALCSYKDTVSVEFHSSPVTSSDSVACNLTGSAGVTNSQTGGYWSYDYLDGNDGLIRFDPDSSALTPSLTADEYGAYRLTFHDAFCQDTFQTAVFFEEDPSVSLMDTLFCMDEKVIYQLSGSEGLGTTNYEWDDGSSSPTRTFTKNDTGLHWLALHAYCGSDTTSFTVSAKFCELEIPNVFTPNGDGKNDRFVIRGIEEFPNTKVEIFNRWGTRIYESSDYANEWNGEKPSGTPVSEGTYYYVITTEKGDSFAGQVMVLR